MTVEGRIGFFLIAFGFMVMVFSILSALIKSTLLWKVTASLSITCSLVGAALYYS